MGGSGTSTLVAIFLAVLPLVAVLGLWIGSLHNKKCALALYKMDLFRQGFGHMLFSTDKKFPKKILDVKDLQVEENKKVIFVRHAESAWNLVFNKGFALGSKFPERLGNAIKDEALMFTTADSIFIDSPLSPEGTEQANGLRSYIESEAFNELFTSKNCILVASNLRRALSTAVIGFWKHLENRNKRRKVHILSSLQEVTFNVDGVALAGPGESPQFSETELNALGFKREQDFEAWDCFDTKNNFGNKEIRSCGFDRLVQFCEFVFDEDKHKADTVVAAGHSLYFRYFFRHFLDADASHVAKQSKMENCAVVGFNLQKGKLPNGKTWYRIPADSLEVMYLGFEESKKKK